MKKYIYSTIFILFLSVNVVHAQAIISLNDNISLPEDTSSVAISVLDNDSGGPAACMGAFTVSIVSNAIHGNALVSGGQIIYTPDLNFNGNDTIVYMACDCNIGSTNCSTSSVFIVVTPLNDAPIAQNDSDTTLEEQIVVINVMNNDSDIDGGTLNIISAGIAPLNGSAIILASNEISYTPNINFFGIDSFPYQLCDNGLGSFASLCDTAWVLITVTNVNDPPTFFKNDTTINITEGDTICFNIDQFINNVDGNNDTLNYNVYNSSSPLNTDLNSSTSELCFEGSTLAFDTVSIVVCDQSGLCDTFTTYYNTTLVNDVPLATNDTVSVNEDSSIVIDVLNNDVDPELDSLSITILCMSAFGTETVNNNMLEYTPSLNYNGLDTLCYEVCDSGSPVLCDTAYVFITINDLDDTPVLSTNDTTINIQEGDTVCFNVDQFATSVDGPLDTLSYSVNNSSSPSNTSLNSSTSELCFEASNLPNDTVSIIICGQAGLCDTFIVNYNTIFINDAPVAFNDSITVNEDSIIIIDVLINDLDPEFDSLYVDILCESSQGTQSINDNMVEYIPNENFFGLDTLCYVVCDTVSPSLCDTAYIYISVLPILDSIIANADILFIEPEIPGSVDVAGNDVNVDNDSMTVSILNSPSNGSVTINGTEVIYTSDPGFVGYDTLLYQICNTGITCDSSYIYFFVSDNNPITALNDTVDILQSENLVFNPLDNDINLDNDSLTYGIISFPNEGTLIFDAEGNLIYEAALDFIGTVEAQYYVCDNGFPNYCDTATIFFTVEENPFIPNIPNSFSPNGDMVNDYLIIENIHVFTENKLTIFGRWGNVLFAQENYKNNFDASNTQNKKILGKEFAEAVYFYIFTYKTVNGPGEKTGYIHIKR